jgi:protein-S-isoprenylcysteine O-methyltransferase Ste14
LVIKSEKSVHFQASDVRSAPAWGFAQALLLQNWIAGLSMLVFFLPVYLYRVPREEQMMLEHFGEEYRSYMNRTGRIIPRLW